MSDRNVQQDSDRPKGSFPFRALARAWQKLHPSPVETDLDGYGATVGEIQSINLKRASDADLKEHSLQLRELAAAGGPDESLLVEAFALAREASVRAIGLNPFDVQVIAGLAMAAGKIAELPTGEGKTLAAVFPAFWRALAGRGVHVLTFNDYLARRDAAWMGPVYGLLGLTVGCVQEGASVDDKRRAYACDVTYATAKEAGFDFLRDRIAYDPAERVHRPFHVALVDEADSILIDEARVPLVISGLAERQEWDARRLAEMVKALEPGRDFNMDEDRRSVHLTEQGTARLESRLKCGSLYEEKNQRLLESVHCALHAASLLRRDVDYIVRDGRIEIVDEFTGRVMDRRHWPDGLQAAVEAKENLSRRSQGRVLGSITLQHFFGLYPKLCGMTATARSAAPELKEFYGLSVVIVPPHCPSLRVDLPDAVFTHQEAKRQALVAEVRDANATGRPVLVGTSSVKESEELASDLAAQGIPCQVLNARNDESEAQVIARAGMPAAVTISTNMAGRGTDIRLGGPEERERDRVVRLGGLYVIGTNRYDSARIDLQLRGRSGRQGDPGSTRFFISLEDDLFERYGLRPMFIKRFRLQPQDQPLESESLRRAIAHAQRIVEGQNFDIRKSLHKYSSLVEMQRSVLQERRDSLLLSDDSSGFLQERAPELFAEGIRRLGRRRMAELERRALLYYIDRFWSDHLAWIADTRESIHLVGLGGQAPLQEFRKLSTAAFLEIEDRVAGAVISEIESCIKRDGQDGSVLDRLKGPSSTWTYFVNEDQFGWGMELLKGRNIGYAAAAALYWGPLLILNLVLNRLCRRGEKSGDPPKASSGP